MWANPTSKLHQWREVVRFLAQAASTSKWLSCNMIILMFILTIQLVRNRTPKKASPRVVRPRNQTLTKESKTNLCNLACASSLNKPTTLPTLCPCRRIKWPLPTWHPGQASWTVAMKYTMATRQGENQFAIVNQWRRRRAEDSQSSMRTLRMTRGQQWWWRISPTSTLSRCCLRSSQ